jgi:hypothetical protein
MFENMICTIEESKDLAKLFVDELVGLLLTHDQRKKLKKKSFSRRPFKQRWFSKRRHCMSRKENNAANLVVAEDVIEEKQLSRGSQAQLRENDREANKVGNPTLSVITAERTGSIFGIAGQKRK